MYVLILILISFIIHVIKKIKKKLKLSFFIFNNNSLYLYKNK